MKRKTKRRCLIAVAVLAAGFVALNVLAYRHAHCMMNFTQGGPSTARPEALTVGGKIKVLLTGVNVPRPHAELSPAEAGAGCKSMTISCADGVRLSAWYWPNEDAEGLVIGFHGYAADKSSLLREAAVFRRLGLAVMLVDFRGSGESSESYTTIGYHEAEDVGAAVRAARDRLPHSRIVLFGRSMGAAAVLRAIHSHGARPDAVIVEGVFDTMANTIRNRFDAMGVPSFPSAELLVFWGGWQAGFNGFAHSPVDYAEAVACPVLFLHGSGDPRVRPAEARRVYRAVSSPKLFTEFPEAGHEPCIARCPGKWRNAVLEFLRTVQAAPAPDG